MGYFTIVPACTGLTMPVTGGMRKTQQINRQLREQGIVPSGKPCSAWIYGPRGGMHCHLLSPSPAKQPARDVQTRPLGLSLPECSGGFVPGRLFWWQAQKLQVLCWLKGISKWDNC